MRFTEIVEEIPDLSFAQREEAVRRSTAENDFDLVPGEDGLLDVWMEDSRRNPETGLAREQLKGPMAQRLTPR